MRGGQRRRGTGLRRDFHHDATAQPETGSSFDLSRMEDDRVTPEFFPDQIESVLERVGTKCLDVHRIITSIINGPVNTI